MNDDPPIPPWSVSNDHAMTRGELAARIGVSPNWVTRNVPAALFVGGRILWHEFVRARERQAIETAAECVHRGLKVDCRQTKRALTMRPTPLMLDSVLQ